ncbi:tyrosine--tRNA ligase [Entomospira culicis]|uniref:Tyrosine--tRNA ligase n=1 Tax=Entomospira culicis TaxID=2719989 RepID=A0A968KW28_9SPIO|nr:tyrosine--tRNA ligase [Entomospira culicis]NIZ19307.1 tyrosine--tRNA ligase [Entomospira culicis]NIZ69788.1 tyrosine--tRNA ligase [Entomospira culicis]WDI36899.1 tyrosine--tRNA ligase [Entomospira culicis]WDI38528.1 tyrosine--tRNA ligase [Entomospira culicis]
MKETLFTELHQRGFFNQCTNEAGLAKAILEHREKNLPFAVYLGVDPTAESLHIGHTLPLYMLKHLQNIGLKIIVIVGGGTARIGDPSGKSSARPILTQEKIESNAQKIKTQVMRFFADDPDVTFVDNGEWLNELRYIDFLRDIGKHFSVNRMLSFDTYASRLESGLSFLEFNYQLLQSYDFAQLFSHHHCKLQIGGQDQWGNIISGVDLIRRLHGEEVFGLTCPLIMTSSGQKMGKSENGAIFLDASLTSPSEFYQYWRNCSDADVERYLKLFTFLPLEITQALTKEKSVEAIAVAKDRLAYETTKLIHGEDVAQQSQEQSRILFTRFSEPLGQKEREDRVKHIVKTAIGGALLATITGGVGLAGAIVGAAIGKATSSKSSSGGIAYSTLSTADLAKELTLADLFVQAGLANSKGEYRKKLVAGKAAYCNEALITEADAPIHADLFIDGAILLRAGKKRYYIFVLEA